MLLKIYIYFFGPPENRWISYQSFVENDWRDDYDIIAVDNPTKRIKMKRRLS